MPQLTQLGDVALSQFLWLAVALAVIYFGIARAMLPKIQATVDGRELKISGDLEAAQRARDEAEGTEAAYRAQIDASRAEAAKLTEEAKAAGARDMDAKVRAASDQIRAKQDSAEAGIRSAIDAARAEVEKVAVEATREMVARLTGQDIDAGRAEQAVKAALANG